MHFVVWGAYQGIMLIVHKEFRRIVDPVAQLRALLDSAVGRLLCTVLTFHAVCIGWVFFRAETFESACTIIQKLLLIPEMVTSPGTALALTLPGITDPVIFMILPMIILVLFGGQIVSGLLANKNIKMPEWLDVAYVASMALLLLIFSPDTSPKFIYFQF